MLGGDTQSFLISLIKQRKICWYLKNFLSVAKMASLVYERENCVTAIFAIMAECSKDTTDLVKKILKSKTENMQLQHATGEIA